MVRQMLDDYSFVGWTTVDILYTAEEVYSEYTEERIAARDERYLRPLTAKHRLTEVGQLVLDVLHPLALRVWRGVGDPDTDDPTDFDTAPNYVTAHFVPHEIYFDSLSLSNPWTNRRFPQVVRWTVVRVPSVPPGQAPQGARSSALRVFWDEQFPQPVAFFYCVSYDPTFVTSRLTNNPSLTPLAPPEYHPIIAWRTARKLLAKYEKAELWRMTLPEEPRGSNSNVAHNTANTAAGT
ncbi:MAG: hypothetical protein QXO86_01485 [Nitrososphaerota archaeon]